MNSKIAFIKFAGWLLVVQKSFTNNRCKFTQDKYDIDYFYCDSAPYLGSDFKHIDTDMSRIDYCLKNKVNLIKFNVEYKDVTTPTHDWVNTDFWDYFDESKYDLLITGRGGYKEYPFI